MGTLLIVCMLVMFVAGAFFGYALPRPANKSLEGRYRKALLAIGSGTSGNPQLEAQLALEQEENK